MTPSQLWNDHTFRVLLDDLFKARRDDQLGPLRLEAIFRYVEGTQASLTGRPPAPALKPAKSHFPVTEKIFDDAVRETTKIDSGVSAFQLEEAEEPVEAKSYLEARRAERQDPEATLKLAADIVQKAVEVGNWTADGTMVVRVPRKYVVSGLQAILKARRVPVSAISCSIAPKKTHIDVTSASAISGSVGEGNGGWDVLVTR